MFGFLNIYKPKGITSHSVINKLRKILEIQKIGHAGTLDPLAEGVLPVAVSYATKLIDYLPTEKEYIAEFQLGYISDSYDTECELVKYSKRKETQKRVEEIIKTFLGETKQRPPIYSAIKQNGKKLYELAREGKNNITIPERTIQVKEIKLIKFNEEAQSGTILINCSKGTYIRSIINDIGEKLGTGGVMSGLIRSKSGGMDIKNSIRLEDFSNKEDINKSIIKPTEILKFHKVNINKSEYQRIRNGQGIKTDINNGLAFLIYEDRISAFAEIYKNFIKIKKVFL